MYNKLLNNFHHVNQAMYLEDEVFSCMNFTQNFLTA